MYILEKKPGGIYFFVAMAFSLLVLAYSLWILYSSISYYQQGQMESFYFSLLASSVGMLLAFSSLMHMRRRIAFLYSMTTRVLTTVVCEKCNFKLLRPFSSGDYVHKEAGKCQQCDGETVITSIYAEETKKKLI